VGLGLPASKPNTILPPVVGSARTRGGVLLEVVTMTTTTEPTEQDIRAEMEREIEAAIVKARRQLRDRVGYDPVDPWPGVAAFVDRYLDGREDEGSLR